MAPVRVRAFVFVADFLLELAIMLLWEYLREEEEPLHGLAKAAAVDRDGVAAKQQAIVADDGIQEENGLYPHAVAAH